MFGKFSSSLVQKYVTLFTLSFAGYLEDVNVNGCDVYVQKFLHHNGDVFTDAVLCVCWSNSLWMCEIWRESRKVRFLSFF